MLLSSWARVLRYLAEPVLLPSQVLPTSAQQCKHCTHTGSRSCLLICTRVERIGRKGQTSNTAGAAGLTKRLSFRRPLRESDLHALCVDTMSQQGRESLP